MDSSDADNTVLLLHVPNVPPADADVGHTWALKATGVGATGRHPCRVISTVDGASIHAMANWVPIFVVANWVAILVESAPYWVAILVSLVGHRGEESNNRSLKQRLISFEILRKQA